MDRKYCGRKNSNLTPRASGGDSVSWDTDDKALEAIRRDCDRVVELQREIAELQKKWKDADLNRSFEDPRKAKEWQSCLQTIMGEKPGNARGEKKSLTDMMYALIPSSGKKTGSGDRPKTTAPPQPIVADEGARLLREIVEASDRLGNLSDEMQKLYGGSSGIQRLRVITKDDPWTPVKSAEALLLEDKIRQLADAWREYKAIQARFADPAYDRPFRDPELEARRKVILRLIRMPCENQTAYDEIEACAYERNDPAENDDA